MRRKITVLLTMICFAIAGLIILAAFLLDNSDVAEWMYGR